MLGDDDRVLAHCFAGKDRTGFTIAVVLEAAGVDRDAIMADYLASNAAVPELRAHIVETIRNRMSDDARSRRGRRSAADRCGARRAGGLPRRGTRAIIEDFGSLDGYLEAAGVTRDDVARLRAALLG